MTSSRTLVCSAVLAAFSTCCTDPSLPERDTPRSQGVVLPLSRAPDVLHQCSRSTPEVPDGYWEPTDGDIQSIENSLPAFLRTRPEEPAAYVLEHLSQYTRQYAGFVRGTHRTIYINLFLSAYAAQWRHQVVVVCDGGLGFWGVELDVTSHVVVHIAFNGVG